MYFSSETFVRHLSRQSFLRFFLWLLFWSLKSCTLIIKWTYIKLIKKYSHFLFVIFSSNEKHHTFKTVKRTRAVDVFFFSSNSFAVTAVKEVKLFKMLLFSLIQISDSNYADYYCEWCRLNANTYTLHLIECFQLLKMYINKYVTHFYILCQMFYYIFPLSLVLLLNTSWYVAEGSRVLYKAFREAYREL